MSNNHYWCSGYLSYPLFFAKRGISFEVSTFRGSLFSGGSMLSGFLLTPVTFYRYFLREREKERERITFRVVLLNILVKSRIAYSLVSNMNYKEKRVSTNQFWYIKIHTGLRGLGELNKRNHLEAQQWIIHFLCSIPPSLGAKYEF